MTKSRKEKLDILIKLNIAINVEEILNIYYDNEEQEKVSKEELVVIIIVLINGMIMKGI